MTLEERIGRSSGCSAAMYSSSVPPTPSTQRAVRPVRRARGHPEVARNRGCNTAGAYVLPTAGAEAPHARSAAKAGPGPAAHWFLANRARRLQRLHRQYGHREREDERPPFGESGLIARRDSEVASPVAIVACRHVFRPALSCSTLGRQPCWPVADTLASPARPADFVGDAGIS